MNAVAFGNVLGILVAKDLRRALRNPVPYLIQLGLIARTARGRCLNDRGWQHLGITPPSGSQAGLFDSDDTAAD